MDCLPFSLSAIRSALQHASRYSILSTSLMMGSNLFLEEDLVPYHGGHIWYAAVAVVFLIFIVILPPLLLTFYPLFFEILSFCNLSECRIAKFLSRIIPIQFRDSFQSLFKDNCRFFAGLYSIFRTIALVTSTMIQDPQSFYAMVELELVLIILSPSNHSAIQGEEIQSKRSVAVFKPCYHQWNNTVQLFHHCKRRETSSAHSCHNNTPNYTDVPSSSMYAGNVHL